MATEQHDYSDDEFDFDEEYFSRTYQPLSNLPTPPPSSCNSWGTQTPTSTLEEGDLLQSALLGELAGPWRLPPSLLFPPSLRRSFIYLKKLHLLTSLSRRIGPAIHLVNLIPAKASLASPSVAIVHDMLRRANLPVDTIALAVCILDSLNSKKFSLNWRLICPLVRSDAPSMRTKRHTLPAAPTLTNQLNIDCVNPEVMILSALIIAFKFLEDTCYEPTGYYSYAWGAEMWTDGQINVTERCIMESLDYRILPLWDSDLIRDAAADMERAGKQATLPLRPSLPRAGSSDDHHKRSMSSGKAVYGRGLQLTPVETPKKENMLLRDFAHGLVGDDVRAAFVAGSTTITAESLRLPAGLQRTTSSGQLLGL